MAYKIRDFILSLGFDSTEVDKGLKQIEKKLGNVASKKSIYATKQAKAAKETSKAAAKTTKELAKQNSLERAKLSLEKSIFRLRTMGGDTRGLSNSLRSNDIDKVNAAKIKADQIILESQKNISKEKQRQKAAAERIAKVQENAAKIEKQRVLDTKKAQDLQIREAKELIRLKKQSATVDQQRFQAQRAAMRLQAQLEDKMKDRNISAGTRNAYSASHSGVTGILSGLASAETASEVRDLNNRLGVLRDKANQASAAQRRLNKNLSVGQQAAKGFEDSLRNLGRSYVSVFAVIGGGAAIANTGQTLTGLRATLLGVSGDAKTAAEDFQFVKDTSKELGINLTEATRAYGKMGAAAKSAGLSLEQGREIFLATSELSTAFQLSEADFEGVSRAMSQILS